MSFRLFVEESNISKIKGLKFNRIGPMSARKDDGKNWVKPPVSRGLWVVPYPLSPGYLAHHQHKYHLPKRLQNIDWTNIKLDDPLTKEYNDAMEKISAEKMQVKTIWWNKPFYCHIPPKGAPGGYYWYLWDSFREFQNMMKRRGPNTSNIATEFDECFLPEVGSKLLPWVGKI